MTGDRTSSADATPIALLGLRSVIGGALMGLANLVPGISGGTMLLAAGIYPRFISAIGEVTTLTFRRRSLVVLGCVIATALVAIVALAGPVKDLVVHHRWVMYSLFIGLTLGGVPVVWRLIGRPTARMWIAAACGFAGMAALALAQSHGGASADRGGFVLMFLAGAAGASAMILPGVSGGYLLLVLGVYVPLLAAIAAFKDALGVRDTDTIVHLGLSVILPVGLGVIVGVVVISNLLRWLLNRYEKATLGFLLGLLLGAVVGLWPFQTVRHPEDGQIIKGRVVTIGEVQGHRGIVFADNGEPVDAEDFPTVSFRPAAWQIGGAIGLIIAGFAVTMVVDLIGREKRGSPGRGQCV